MAELQKIDVLEGTGAEARPGPISVHYTGWLHDPAKSDGHGKKFDSSVDRGTPFDFNLGAGQVIRGWDEGVAGMKLAASEPSSSRRKWGTGRAVPAASSRPMRRWCSMSSW